jgi:plastocyanin
MPTATGSSYGSKGTGATHTVIVAPTQGVLRYVPFAVNASVGDTIQFMWGANNHTVTKSSALTPCNKSTDGLFASGTQNKDFECTYSN